MDSSHPVFLFAAAASACLALDSRPLAADEIDLVDRMLRFPVLASPTDRAVALIVDKARDCVSVAHGQSRGAHRR